MKICWIKSVSWEYSCDQEYFEEFNTGKLLKYSLPIAVLPGHRLDPLSSQIPKSKP